MLNDWMKKKFLYVGIALILISIIIFGYIIHVVSSISSPSVQSKLGITNYTISKGGFESYNFTSNGNTSAFIAIMEEKVDFLIFNSSGYNLWIGNATLANAKNLEGRGTMLITLNSTNFTIPLPSSENVYYLSKRFNLTNLKKGLLPIGNYTSVFYNGPGSYSSNSSTNVVLTYLPSSKLSYLTGFFGNFAILGVVAIIAFIAGIILIIYSFFSKEKVLGSAGIQGNVKSNGKGKGQNSQEDKYIDDLYKYVDNGNANKKPKSTKAAASKRSKKSSKPKQQEGS